MARQQSCKAYSWKPAKAHQNGRGIWLMRAFAKAPQISSPSATTTRSSRYETRSLRRWTSHRRGSRPHFAWPTRRFSAAFSACSSWSTDSLPLSCDFLYRELLYKSKFRWRCKCCDVFVTHAGLLCTPLTNTASGFHAWALPALKQHSPGRNVTTAVTWIIRQGGLSSKRLFTLAERLLRWAQHNLRLLRAEHVPGKLNLGADMLSRSNVPSDEWTLHPQTVQEKWRIFIRPEVDLFASEDNTHCQIFFQRTGTRWPTTGPTSSFMPFPRIALIPLVIRRILGTEAQSSVSGPALAEPALVRLAVLAAHCSPVAHSPETTPHLSGERNDLAPPARTLGVTSLASWWEPSDLPESVLNTIYQARAPSTRHLYALKWSVFSAWCTTRDADPVLGDISLILSFLQELSKKSRSPSMLQDLCSSYSSLTRSYRWPISGQEQPGCSFLEESRRLNPSCPLTIPTWDLPTVLRALKRAALILSCFSLLTFVPWC